MQEIAKCVIRNLTQRRNAWQIACGMWHVASITSRYRKTLSDLIAFNTGKLLKNEQNNLGAKYVLLHSCTRCVYSHIVYSQRVRQDVTHFVWC